jgi:two-component system, OmpR family, KDP operon response regulator KdpE
MANTYTVLVVDDEPPIRHLLCTSLTAAGYRVASADDAAGALAGLASEKPDVIILDLGLPDSSGLNLIIDIRRRSPVPIIVLWCATTSARKSRRSISAPTTLSASPSACPS